MSKTTIGLGELMRLICKAYELQDEANKLVRTLENIVRDIKTDD